MMKSIFKTFLLTLGVLPALGSAQSVDTLTYTDFSPYQGEPDPSLLIYGAANQGKQVKTVDVSLRPDHVNNMKSICFPPVFNQAGGSCGSASRIGYMFTHEMNAYHGTDASFMENCYPTHFVWLFTKGNSGKGEFMRNVGIPSAVDYGGRTYSDLFGNQADGSNDFGWMTGYDKWYSGMFNRIEKETYIPANVGTEEGREALKNWLWNHNGDTDYVVGGIGGIGVATGSLKDIPSTPANDENGLTGLKCVNHWGNQVNHALTIVGYDDRVEFDLDGDSIFGEVESDEKGAWIIVNSWGTKWGNGGAVYCPYAYGGKRFDLNQDGSYTFDRGSWWLVELLKVRKNYRPLRTIKVKMDYTHRSEICLSAGISTDLNADSPAHIQVFDHFIYAGDGNRGNTNPAPAVPLLGRWADGRLHDEPMEFGFDLTDLTEGYDRSKPLKYFFIVETRAWGQGKGHIYNASIIDYEFEKRGIEFPFDLQGSKVEIKSQGNKTVLSVIVQGEGYFAPGNVTLKNGSLTWESPEYSMFPISGYNIYKNGELEGRVDAAVSSYSIHDEEVSAVYGVATAYADGRESDIVKVITASKSQDNVVVDLKKGGFVVPDLFKSFCPKSTIEFWYCPKSKEGGAFEASVGDFFFNAFADGKMAVGWDQSNRIVTSRPVLAPGQWTHVGIVVDGGLLSLYINGYLFDSFQSKKYQGLGDCVRGQGNLIFRTRKKVNTIQAYIDEIRIWEIAKNRFSMGQEYKTEFMGSVLPGGLIAYYKGNIFTEKIQKKMVDFVGAHPAVLEGTDAGMEFPGTLKLSAFSNDFWMQIKAPEQVVHAGVPVHLFADYGHGVSSLHWMVKGQELKEYDGSSPMVIFNKSGEYEIVAKASSLTGETMMDTCLFTVEKALEATADFTLSKTTVPLGERVSLFVKNPVLGCTYEWTLPGADVEYVRSQQTSVTYGEAGSYEVKLTAKDASGKIVSSSQRVEVIEVAPIADFEVFPAVIVKGSTVFLKDKSKFNPTSWRWALSSDKHHTVINGQNTSLTPERTGVFDITLMSENAQGRDQKTQHRALVVCNADSKSGLNFGGSGAHVVLSEVPLSAGNTAFTIDWWMNPGKISTFNNGFGDSENTFLLKNDGDGVMYMLLNGEESRSARKFVVPYEWHHYAVTFNKGTASFYRDGVYVSSATSSSQMLPALKKFSIGLEHMNMSGQIDEFRVWGKAMTEKEIQTYANAPITQVKDAEERHKLLVYYDFNQGSGDVIDATSHHNTGIRVGFGPDGDAWGLSTGVFCLDLEQAVAQNVSDVYLKNYAAPFVYDSNVTNNSVPNRFYSIKDWTLENRVTANNCTSGVYVDSRKKFQFTCATGWDGFADLKDHKAYQTVTLPAGKYTFVANYGTHASNVKGNLMVVSKGVGLPDAAKCKSEALAVTEILPKSGKQMSNSLEFTLDEETEVSIGLVINMAGQQCMVLNNFQLLQTPFEILQADGANGYELQVGPSRMASMFLPYAVLVPENVVAYCATNIVENKVVLKPVTDGVIPANEGVIIVAETGCYHFSPSTKSGTSQSLLAGVIKDTPVDVSSRNYVLNIEGEARLDLFLGDVVPAHTAYLKRDSSEQVDSYLLDFVELGVGHIDMERSESVQFYDLGGRPVSLPSRGVCVTKDKKVLVR